MTSTNKATILAAFVRFIKSDFGIALGITLAWKLVMITIGYLIDSNASGTSQALLHHTGMWDGGWYGVIINDHYQTNAASAAFYPLFPFLVGLVHTASFGLLDILAAGQIINTLSAWLAVAALLTLGRIFLGSGKRYWLIALVLSSPAAFFMHVFYGESLFMALGFWAYIFALRRQWLYMGLVLAALTSARLPSLLFVGLCGLEFMRAYKWKIKKVLNRNLLYFLLAPIGFVTYGTYLLIERGDFLGMFHAYQATTDWIYQVPDINIVKTIYKIILHISHAIFIERHISIELIVNFILPIISLFILGVSSLYLLIVKKGKYIPLGLFGLVSIIMFTLNSNVISVHRYVLPCLTTYIVVAILLKGKFQYTFLVSICATGIALQLLLFSLFINSMFAG